MYSQQIFVNHDFSVKARKRALRAQADTTAASSVCGLVLVQLCRTRGRERGAGEGCSWSSQRGKLRMGCMLLLISARLSLSRQYLDASLSTRELARTRSYDCLHSRHRSSHSR